MNNIISIIERLGSDSELRYKPVNAIQNNDPDTTEAIESFINGSIDKVESMLNARNKIVCMIFPVEEPKDKPDEPEEDDQPKEAKIA